MNNDASADEIRSQIQACSNIRINMQVAAYETANNMKSVLTDKQKEKMKNMMMQQGGMNQGGMNQGSMMKNMNQQ